MPRSGKIGSAVGGHIAGPPAGRFPRAPARKDVGATPALRQVRDAPARGQGTCAAARGHLCGASAGQHRTGPVGGPAGIAQADRTWGCAGVLVAVRPREVARLAGGRETTRLTGTGGTRRPAGTGGLTSTGHSGAAGSRGTAGAAGRETVRLARRGWAAGPGRPAGLTGPG